LEISGSRLAAPKYLKAAPFELAHVDQQAVESLAK
jgi:hypothetical protein